MTKRECDRRLQLGHLSLYGSTETIHRTKLCNCIHGNGRLDYPERTLSVYRTTVQSFAYSTRRPTVEYLEVKSVR